MRTNYFENNYKLPNVEKRLSKEEITRSLSDFDYFTSNFQQIVNKQRQVAPMKLNLFQQKIFKTLLPMIRPDTRLNRRHNVILLKPRQVGASTGIVAFINYMCSLVDGMNHLNVLHTFPVGDTISKFYQQKLQPIITGVHPDLFPNIEKETGKTSIVTHYDNLRGKIVRDNYYELVSANASSIRSSTCHIALFDEVAFYRKPEELEDAISPALPEYGFSLVVYLSTFEDQKSSYFLDKIKIAMEEPDDWTLIFTPWFEMYPEHFFGNDLNESGLSAYDREVILPALVDAHLDEEKFGDYIDWYHRKSRTTTHMLKEYPTTLEEVIEYAEDEKVFEKEVLDKVEATIEKGRSYRLVQDIQTKGVSAIADDNSPLRIYRPPIQGHKYILTVDPILSSDDKSDYFAVSVWDNGDNGQVATILGRGLAIEDWADMVYSLAILYNRAMICPETNVAQSLYILIWAKGYYNWFYLTDKDRTNKNPGIRTTATTKTAMISRLILGIKNGRIIIRDKDTLDQMNTFVVRRKSGDSSRSSGKMEAKKGHHDDLVATIWIFAGMLQPQGLTKKEGRGWAI